MFGVELMKNDKLAISPNQIPANLVHYQQCPVGTTIITTKVPSSKEVLVFYRPVVYSPTVPAVCVVDILKDQEFVRLQVLVPPGINTPILVYVFANHLVNTPDWGIFVYNNGEIVWHANTLPLKCRLVDLTEDLVSTIPIAITPGYSGLETVDPTGGSGYWTAISAFGFNGIYTGSILKHRVMSVEVRITYTNSAFSRTDTQAAPLCIDTTFYDQYYQQVLGT
ncbi:hypothetical protein P13BB106kb_p108 [Pectobacterium phage DU_PP_V]|uniref:Uncharacterized protein n=1 Tax=Pectobacterium phage DU_PP_V TaxID=2041492 RepID=A0A2D2W721_9CAUD|nr:membrane associated protein [Pectobacterium phage DU_PP_V]ATS94092.1 hypothetical protein P13BB106kb_p108 [Pectobacterium phage DU_PP_V]